MKVACMLHFSHAEVSLMTLCRTRRFSTAVADFAFCRAAVRSSTDFSMLTSALSSSSACSTAAVCNVSKSSLLHFLMLARVSSKSEIMARSDSTWSAAFEDTTTSCSSRPSRSSAAPCAATLVCGSWRF